MERDAGQRSLQPADELDQDVRGGSAGHLLTKLRDHLRHHRGDVGPPARRRRLRRQMCREPLPRHRDLSAHKHRPNHAAPPAAPPSPHASHCAPPRNTSYPKGGRTTPKRDRSRPGYPGGGWPAQSSQPWVPPAPEGGRRRRQGRRPQRAPALLQPPGDTRPPSRLTARNHSSTHEQTARRRQVKEPFAKVKKAECVSGPEGARSPQT